MSFYEFGVQIFFSFFFSSSSSYQNLKPKDLCLYYHINGDITHYFLSANKCQNSEKSTRCCRGRYYTDKIWGGGFLCTPKENQLSIDHVIFIILTLRLQASFAGSFNESLWNRLRTNHCGKFYWEFNNELGLQYTLKILWNI